MKGTAMVSSGYIAESLRKLRKESGMTVDEVGAAVGRSGKSVSAWETGRNVPSADMLIDICRLFGVSIEYFYPPEVHNASECAPDALTAEERELVDLFRSLSEKGRHAVLTGLRDFAGR